MGAKTKIEWADASWTPIRARNLATGKVGWHCEHVTPGCEFCYAENINKRLGTGVAFKPGHKQLVDIFLDEKMLMLPLRWQKPKRIFVCSMTDLFADFVPDAWIDRVFGVMWSAHQHVFQILTKRPERMQAYVWEAVKHAALPGNIWLGISAEDQRRADERISPLLYTPAAVRWVSAEPLLGPINFGDEIRLLDWIVVGGESGPNARPMNPEWARSIRDQCAAAGVPFLFKQWGEWLPEDEAYDRSLPCIAVGLAPTGMYRVGKHAAGRTLDGVVHDGYPA